MAAVFGRSRWKTKVADRVHALRSDIKAELVRHFVGPDDEKDRRATFGRVRNSPRLHARDRFGGCSARHMMWVVRD